MANTECPRKLTESIASIYQLVPRPVGERDRAHPAQEMVGP